MKEPFVGSDAVAAGLLTPYALRSRYTRVFPDVYIRPDMPTSARLKAEAAFRWTGGGGIIAGRSAAAMHRSKYVDASKPAEIIYGNRHAPKGIRTWADTIDDDEVTVVDGLRVTTPARTALDLACRNSIDLAVEFIDALANATGLKTADVDLLAQRYPGRRGIRQVAGILDLVDAGSQSPRESWLRLLLIREGFPRPRTQIPVYDATGYAVAYLDMGWDDIKVAVEYEGDHHRTDRRQFHHDIRRYEEVAELGWIAVRVTAEDSKVDVVRRVNDARARRM